jgi:hypothetical protein
VPPGRLVTARAGCPPATRRPGREGDAGESTVRHDPHSSLKVWSLLRAPSLMSSQKPSVCEGKCELTEGRAGGTVTSREPSSRDARSSWRNAHAPRRSSRSLDTLPALSAVSATATACQGRGRDGRVPFSFGRQLPSQAPPHPWLCSTSELAGRPRVFRGR